ncbi:MAG TPA: RidA family protein [Candidatus Limnocylindrales bacterium]|nr:RidA family protein [Candidatus Limnocylindrales bacterium]
MTDRRHVSSGGPWEERAGYSRAIVAGDACFVSGTTDAGPDGRSTHPGDIAAQADAIFGIIARALEQAGFGIQDIVRTRMLVTDLSHAPELLEVHRRWLGEFRPAATLLQVAGLIDPSLLVEIEVDARR